MSKKPEPQIRFQTIDDFFRKNLEWIEADNIHQFREDYDQAYKQVGDWYGTSQFVGLLVAVGFLAGTMIAGSRHNALGTISSALMTVVLTCGSCFQSMRWNKIEERHLRDEVDPEVVEALRPVNKERGRLNRLRDPLPGKVVYLSDRRP